ncbi:hypothetical protein I7I50_07752 [Histoplasma capsulatum G186AR]|uniref:Uncharacterized protein n=1 Tax=Ajellomyces capsulatus TaxID=5037 RepID=A0A8H8D305_AJECA|nr:hypothetical protein I7I52_09175 [Histoplasma capsulatum]QSS68369.1 hypothetical protein I7I50_07752 [Histoplasma capsulatum G186AR]
MASQTQFQLFPQVQPLNKPNGNPFRKGNRRRATKSPVISPILGDDKTSFQTEAVILQIIEDTNKTPLAPSPTVHIVSANSPSLNTELREKAKVVEYPQLSENGKSVPPQPTSPEPIRSGSPVQIEVTTSPPRSPTSPVVSMRSIFPRYDPNVPLSQQQYYPQRSRPNDLPREVISRCDYSQSVASPQSASSRTMRESTQLAAAAKVTSSQQLTRLWEAANGEGPQPELGTFHLRISKTDHLTYTFGSQSATLYTLKTNSMGDVDIQRSHPTKENTKSPIVTMSNTEINRPKGNGFTTVIFPMLAEILARDQALSLSRQHQLAPTDAMEVEEDAVRRAEAQESCILEWNGSHGRYDVLHQALFNDPSDGQENEIQQQGFPIINKRGQTLRLSVSASTTDSAQLDHPPSILVTIPGRDSTKDIPLVALDLETMTLSISAGIISSTIPALYCIDSLVASVLIIAATDQFIRSILGGMSIETAVTKGEFPDPYNVTSSRAPSAAATFQPGFNGQLIATQAEREEAEQEAKLMSQIHSSSKRKKRYSFWKRSSSSSPETKTKVKKSIKKAPVVIEEIDLENYGKYSSGSREGEKLPGITRSVLKLIFWGFKAVIWGLTVALKFIAWFLVKLTRCFTSEKF